MDGDGVVLNGWTAVACRQLTVSAPCAFPRIPTVVSVRDDDVTFPLSPANATTSVCLVRGTYPSAWNHDLGDVQAFEALCIFVDVRGSWPDSTFLLIGAPCVHRIQME